MTAPDPIESPTLGVALTKTEVAARLGMTVNAVDVALHRTRRGVARIDFPGPDAPDDRWWSVTIDAYRSDRGQYNRNMVSLALAREIRRARATTGASTDALSRRFGVSTATISRVLNNITRPEPTTEES